MMMRAIGRLIDAVTARLTSAKLAVAVGEPLFRLFGFRRQGPFRLGDAGSVLVIRLDHIGDIVLTTSLLRELRRGLPGASITLVVTPVAKELFEACPYIDDVLAFDPRLTGNLPVLRRHCRALVLAARSLWRKRIDLVLAPRFSRDMYHALFVGYLSGGAWRVTYDQPNADAAVRADVHCLASHVLHGEPGTKHEVLRNMEFLEHLGLEPKDAGLELWTRARDVRQLDKELGARGTGPGPWVVVSPGAGEAKKRWPAAHYSALAPLLSARLQMPVMVIGDESEWALGREIEAVDQARVFNLCGRLPLGSLAALFDRCALFVGNDSGPKHIAAARGVPVVEICLHPLSAPAHHAKSPERFGPWGVPHRICRPPRPLPPCRETCISKEAHCILAVSVRDVMAAVEDLLEEVHPMAGEIPMNDTGHAA